jgi:fermentation-respiration switch protein FrsA (DUF1100 family)
MDAARISKFIVNRLLVLGVALLVVAILIRVFENKFIYFPPHYPDGWVSPTVYALPVEDVWLTADDGVRINAWFLANSASPKVLLWFHGNAENIGMGLEQMKTLSHLGINIFAIDYRDYGKSEGSPNEAGVYRDGEAAYRYLVEARHFVPRNIFIYGHSLGGAVATEIAYRHECGGLIVESSFTSARDMARKIMKIPFMEYVTKSRFDSIGKIPQIHAPVMIIHGREDKLIPFSMGQRLYAAAREPKTFLATQSGHDDPYILGGKEYWDHWRTFINGS